MKYDSFLVPQEVEKKNSTKQQLSILNKRRIKISKTFLFPFILIISTLLSLKLLSY